MIFAPKALIAHGRASAIWIYELQPNRESDRCFIKIEHCPSSCWLPLDSCGDVSSIRCETVTKHERHTFAEAKTAKASLLSLLPISVNWQVFQLAIGRHLNYYLHIIKMVPNFLARNFFVEKNIYQHILVKHFCR